MNRELNRIFSKWLRVKPSEAMATTDGRPISFNATSVRMAEKLFSEDASTNADEIIALMKPFCRPFPVSEVREQLRKARRASGARQGIGNGKHERLI